jgi:hypothetical protein|tara:strand:+ start:22 stop:129 length:108 start_codon:yes stop_codon:yes gene_type:complete
MEVVLTDQVRDAIIALQGGNSSEFKSMSGFAAGAV